MTLIATELSKAAAPDWQKMVRRLFPNLHLYSGMAAFVFAVIFGPTGAVLSFERQIKNWLTRDLVQVAPGPQHLPLVPLVEAASRAYPEFKIVGILLPVQQDRAMTMFLANSKGKQRVDIYVDDHTGRILGSCGRAVL